jgi:hypothetical protein
LLELKIKRSDYDGKQPLIDLQKDAVTRTNNFFLYFCLVGRLHAEGVVLANADQCIGTLVRNVIILA